MHNVFQEFVDRLMTAPDSVALSEALAEALAALDIQTFAYLLVPTGRRPAARLISNYPTRWTAHYLANRYEAIDPVIVQAQRAPGSFGWGPGGELRASCRAEFFEEAACFGIRCGFTIPIHDGRPYTAALSFAADAHDAAFARSIERNQPTLQLVASLFHRTARRLLLPERLVQGATLSPREYECLAWSARGKTAWEIGVILGITRRTVVHHLENAKQKLGVHSITEAVALLAGSAISEL